MLATLIKLLGIACNSASNKAQCTVYVLPLCLKLTSYTNMSAQPMNIEVTTINFRLHTNFRITLFYIQTDFNLDAYNYVYVYSYCLCCNSHGISLHYFIQERYRNTIISIYFLRQQTQVPHQTVVIKVASCAVILLSV